MNAFQIILWIGVGFLVLAIILLLFRNQKADKYAIICLLIGGLFEFMGILGIAAFGTPTQKEPAALDVYRGKTTLEITYRDSVAIDSTVVYKVK